MRSALSGTASMRPSSMGMVMGSTPSGPLMMESASPKSASVLLNGLLVDTREIAAGVVPDVRRRAAGRQSFLRFQLDDSVDLRVDPADALQVHRNDLPGSNFLPPDDLSVNGSRVARGRASLA